MGIEINGCVYELHNFYDFRELRVDVGNNVVSLLFSINTKAAKELNDGVVEILIKFQDIDYFEVSPKFASNLTYDLEEIGYKNSDDRDVDWLISENKSTDADHLLFRFVNDEFIRIHAKNSYCEVLSKVGTRAGG